MGTRDEEIRRFCKHSSVQILLCQRSAGKLHSWLKKVLKTGNRKAYSHHQKTVVVDVDAHSDRRKLISFIGGLDLCGRRYDIPGPVFKLCTRRIITMQTLFQMMPVAQGKHGMTCIRKLMVQQLMMFYRIFRSVR